MIKENKLLNFKRNLLTGTLPDVTSPFGSRGIASFLDSQSLIELMFTCRHMKQALISIYNKRNSIELLYGMLDRKTEQYEQRRVDFLNKRKLLTESELMLLDAKFFSILNSIANDIKKLTENNLNKMRSLYDKGGSSFLLTNYQSFKEAKYKAIVDYGKVNKSIYKLLSDKLIKADNFDDYKLIYKMMKIILLADIQPVNFFSVDIDLPPIKVKFLIYSIILCFGAKKKINLANDTIPNKNTYSLGLKFLQLCSYANYKSTYFHLKDDFIRGLEVNPRTTKPLFILLRIFERSIGYYNGYNILMRLSFQSIHLIFKQQDKILWLMMSTKSKDKEQILSIVDAVLQDRKKTRKLVSYEEIREYIIQNKEKDLFCNLFIFQLLKSKEFKSLTKLILHEFNKHKQMNLIHLRMICDYRDNKTFLEKLNEQRGVTIKMREFIEDYQSQLKNKYSIDIV